MRVRSCSGEDLYSEAPSCIGPLILLLVQCRNKTGNFGRRVVCRISTAIRPGADRAVANSHASYRFRIMT